MVRLLISALICVSFAFATPSLHAQDYDAQGRSRSPGPRKQIATIIFAGLAGGVLGLSTLSFYGRPQDKLANVPMGVGIGVIIGAIYTTFNAATKPREFMNETHNQWDLSPAPEAWELTRATNPPGDPVMSAGWQWSF
jgi:hypothetical protein